MVGRFFSFFFVWLVAISFVVPSLIPLLAQDSFDSILDNVVLTASNPTNDAGLAPASLAPASSSTSSSQDPSLEEIVKRMASQGLTIHTTVEKFKPDDRLSREVMAKFVVLFMISQKRQRSHNAQCGFQDIYSATPDLVAFVVTACSMNIMKGQNNKFLPKSSMTKAEAVATLMRMIRNDLSSDATPRYLNYYTTARAYGITNGSLDSMENQLTRGEMAVMLWRAYQFNQ